MAVTINGTTGITTPGMSSSGDITLAGSGVELLNNSGRIVVGQSGSILQVVSTTKTSQFTSTTVGSVVDITGMSASITPTSTSSKILIMVKLMVGNSGAQNTTFVLQLYRGATLINSGDTAGNRTLGFSGSEEGISTNTYGQYQTYDYCTQFLDSPASTSSQTYKVSVYLAATNTFCINSTGLDSDTSAFPRGTSNIILMEVAQ